MGTAAHCLKEREQYPNTLNPRFIGSIYKRFLYGLISLYFVRQQDNSEHDFWMGLAGTTIKTMKKWAGSSKWNCSNKLYLLGKSKIIHFQFAFNAMFVPNVF